MAPSQFDSPMRRKRHHVNKLPWFQINPGIAGDEGETQPRNWISSLVLGTAGCCGGHRRQGAAWAAPEVTVCDSSGLLLPLGPRQGQGQAPTTAGEGGALMLPLGCQQ